MMIDDWYVVFPSLTRIMGKGSTIDSPTTASPTLQGVLKDVFGEAVVACDMSKPLKFPSLDICQDRFLWTHKEVNLALHPADGLMLQLGDTEKFN